MEPTDIKGTPEGISRRFPTPTQAWIWLFAFLILPFASYLSLGLLGGLLGVALCDRASRIFAELWRRGFVLLSIGLVLSAAFALEPGNAFLQIANFVPYFLMFAVLQTWDTLAKQATLKLHRLAIALLLTSLPLSLWALFEYTIKFQGIATHLSELPAFDWAFDNNFGHRARAMLSHPNILSAYLVIILGLGLGLTLQRLSAGQSRGTGARWLSGGIYGATVLSLAGVFCSGSRNGLIIAVGMLIAVGLLLSRRSRFLALMGMGGAIAVVAVAIMLGVGGRAFNLALITQDPRIGVWQIALSLTQHRPLLGWGLGGFSALYVPESVGSYKHIFHAHNLWLYLASEVGIPLMILFNVVIGRIYAGGVKTFWFAPETQWSRTEPQAPSQKSVLLSYLLAFGGCIAFGLFDVTLFDARINVLSWLLLAGISLLTHTGSTQKTQA